MEVLCTHAYLKSELSNAHPMMSFFFQMKHPSYDIIGLVGGFIWKKKDDIVE
jgi:hypothetical protein